jgi:F420-dependent oxidoreductase-like protein
MRIGMSLNYAGGFTETVAELADYENAGLDIVFVPEAYSFDAVSQLGFIAARTGRLQIASGILQLYSRTPTLTAMTAAGLDYVSGGRFTLGIGASGPQVIEGWHGVPYDAPVTRTREIIEICRQVWRRERLEYAGRKYTIPLLPGQGTGLGKPLKLINHPVRERIPIVVAAIGPKNVELAAELAEGWEPIFYFPERAAAAWGGALAAGRARRDPSLPPLDVVAQLRAHGLPATYERVTPQDVPGPDGAGVLDAILNRVFDSGADLLVMGFGSHGRSRLGRTRSSQAVLRSMLTPVLLST